jgi:hypothetical protein
MPEADNAAKSTTPDNEILDARMEYGHLVTSYMSLVNMFWLGYGAFFTINSLLATALGVSYSTNADSMNPKFLFLIHVLIPSTGIFISWCAIYAARQIADTQRLIEERGKGLESTVLRAAIFHGLGKHPRTTPVLTIVGAVFFGALWLSSFLAVGKWPF